MLRILRKKGVAKKILWLLAIMITISFVFFGVASYLTSQKNPFSYAGKIFGRTVSFREFQESFQHAQIQAIMRYGEDFQKISKYLNLNAEAWDRLILLHEAKKRRITIANEEVVKAIKKFSFFQRNGQFDKQLYAQIVQYAFQCAPGEFENGIRESLMFEKIYNQETVAIDLSDADVLKEYETQNAKAQIDYILFSVDQIQNDTLISDEALKAYYQDHQDLFRLPAAINVDFIALEYPQNASEEAKKEIDQTADKIAQDIAKGVNDLKNIAQNYNLKLQESGFFSAENPTLELGWPLEIFQKALNLKPSDLAGPLATHKGFYLLQLKGAQEARLLTFEEAKNKVRDLLALQEAKKNALKKADNALASLKAVLQETPGARFEDMAEKLNYQVEKTPEFTRGEYLPGIGPDSQFQQTAFSLNKENPLSEITEVSNGYAILYLANLIPADQEKFLQEKDFLKDRLLAQRREQAFNTFLTKLRQKASLIDNIKKLEEAQSSQQN